MGIYFGRNKSQPLKGNKDNVWAQGTYKEKIFWGTGGTPSFVPVYINSLGRPHLWKVNLSLSTGTIACDHYARECEFVILKKRKTLKNKTNSTNLYPRRRIILEKHVNHKS